MLIDFFFFVKSFFIFFYGRIIYVLLVKIIYGDSKREREGIKSCVQLERAF